MAKKTSKWLKKGKAPEPPRAPKPDPGRAVADAALKQGMASMYTHPRSKPNG